MMSLIKKLQSKILSYEAIFPPLSNKVSVVTVDNDQKIYIENGCQIMNFTSTKIHLRTSIGDIHIFGTHLLINSMDYQELIIEGNIDQMNYHRLERK